MSAARRPAPASRRRAARRSRLLLGLLAALATVALGAGLDPRPIAPMPSLMALPG